MAAVKHNVYKPIYPRELQMATRLPQYLATFIFKCTLKNVAFFFFKS